MIFSDRFWGITVPRLSEVSIAALVSALGQTDPAKYPPGVFPMSSDTLHNSRFAWAAAWILGDLAAAPGITLDTRTGLGIVWSEIHSPPAANPNMARSRGAKIQQCGASFTSEHLAQVRAQLAPVSQEALDAGAKSAGRRSRIPPAKPRVGPDRFEGVALRAKQLEYQLRAEFGGVEDLGERPGMADRRAVVTIMSTGVTGSQVLEALLGRAEMCRESRMWKGRDTAEDFLRITWICERVTRFADALAAAPEPTPRRGMIKTEHGTFVGGRQLFEAEPPAPQPAAPPADNEPNLLQQWIDEHRADRAEE